MPNKYNAKHLKLWTPAPYRIEAEGDLDESLSECLGGMRISTSRREDQTAVTTLEGPVSDQDELIRVLKPLCTVSADKPITRKDPQGRSTSRRKWFSI